MKNDWLSEEKMRIWNECASKEFKNKYKATIKDGKLVLARKKKRGRKPNPLNRFDILDL